MPKPTPFVDEPLPAPFYTSAHEDFQEAMKAFLQKNCPFPKQIEWSENKIFPQEIIGKMYDEGLCPVMPPDCTPKVVAEFRKYGGRFPNDMKPDYFMMKLSFEAMNRWGSSLAAPTFVSTLAIAPIIRDGSDYIKEQCLRDVFSGRHPMAICISEPGGGSDVADMKTMAVEMDDHYVINGEKYFITNGCRAKYYTLAARTGAKGYKGISLLFVPRSTPGITAVRMKMQGNWSTDTAYITFKDVRVPKKNLIGKKNHGFAYIMEDFNHERFGIAVESIGASKACLEEAIKWARKRKTFGKKLIRNQVIRFKLVEMARKIQDADNSANMIANKIQNTNASPRDLAAPCALLKISATRCLEHCAREASQVFGGRSYIRTGRGGFIEGVIRSTRGAVIYGGSEEIMYELASKMSKL